MNRNFLSNLKEKKKVVKLLMAALVGAITVCGGAALCNVEAMVLDTSSGVESKGQETGVPAAEGENGSREESAAGQPDLDDKKEVIKAEKIEGKNSLAEALEDKGSNNDIFHMLSVLLRVWI